MRLLSIPILCLLLVGCKKDPKPPVAAVLVAPAKNEECTPIASVSGNRNVVEFTWQASANTNSYEVQVTDLTNNSIVERVTTSDVSTTITLDQAKPFSWKVISSNNDVSETATSETWFFYSPGSLTTYAPFPAEIVAPLSGARVAGGDTDEVTLRWSGVDIDSDIESYEVYFSEEMPPQTLIASPTARETSLRVDVSKDTSYYWRVITIDREGNTSDSGIFSFKVL